MIQLIKHTCEAKVWEDRHEFFLHIAHMDSLFPPVVNHPTGEAPLAPSRAEFLRDPRTLLCVSTTPGTRCLSWLLICIFNNAQSLVHPGPQLRIHRNTSSVVLWTFQNLLSQCSAKGLYHGFRHYHW